jgi:hypothetical protein
MRKEMFSLAAWLKSVGFMTEGFKTSPLVHSLLLKCTYLLPKCTENSISKNPTDDRAYYRHPRVLPVRVPLAGNWKYCMRDSRSEVSRRINSISGRSPKRQAYTENN